MALVQWMEKKQRNYFYDLKYLQVEMSKLRDRLLLNRIVRKNVPVKKFVHPAVDIIDTENNVFVKAEIPGMSKNDLEVFIAGNTLVIKSDAIRERQVNAKSGRCKFTRAISLPAKVCAGKINAVYANGFLELTLYKQESRLPVETRLKQ